MRQALILIVQMITSQTQIRIVGLSATLPNYMDVAEFLNVPKEGVFYCDDSFRPVPLSYKYVGITETDRIKSKKMLLHLTYQNIIEELNKNNQVWATGSFLCIGHGLCE